jgi:acyl-CoA thioester hydrolase
MTQPHSIPIRVYYEDTDAGGVVYHANYLKFGERGRTEYLRFLGFENKSLHDQYGVLFVVRHIAADYIKTAHLDDLLRIETSIIQLKNASFTMKQAVFRDQEMVFSMDVALVCVDGENYRPAPLPTPVREKFETYLKDNS